jgi:hypothetical protein
VTSGALRSGNNRSCGCLVTESIRQRQRKGAGRSGARKAFTSCRRGAEDRGHEFALSFEDFVRLTSQPCHYCGVSHSKSVHVKTTTPEGIEYSTYQCNGLDRVKNERGYHLDNVVPACHRCNYAKRMMGYDEFKEWIAQVNRHLHGGAA